VGIQVRDKIGTRESDQCQGIVGSVSKEAALNDERKRKPWGMIKEGKQGTVGCSSLSSWLLARRCKLGGQSENRTTAVPTNEQKRAPCGTNNERAAST
jgi:hypothetical protein